MRITNSNYNSISYSQKLYFQGIKNPKTPCLFVFDLDGTLLEGCKQDIEKVLSKSKERNAEIVFATGRSFEEFKSLRKVFDDFLPNYLVSNNGEFVYQKQANALHKDLNYTQEFFRKMKFDKDKILKILNKMFNNNMIKINEVAESPFVLKYHVPLTTDIKDLKSKVVQHLYDKDIKVLCEYGGENTVNQTLYLAPFCKVTGLKYLKEKLNLPSSEILIAGNDNNDISMARLSQFGSKFICLNNATLKLKNICKELNCKFGNIYQSTEKGTKGILEGMEHFFE